MSQTCSSDTRLDLARGVRVAQDVSPRNGARMPARVAYCLNALRTANSSRDDAEDGGSRKRATMRVSGALAPDVSSERTRHRVEERKHGGAPRLRPADPNRTCDPIQVFERQPGYLGGAHAVGRHHRNTAKSRRPGGPVTSIARKIRRTSFHGSARRGRSTNRTRGQHGGGKVEA